MKSKISKYYINFVKGISVTWFGKIGTVLTTTSFFCFIFFEILRMAGILTNAYIGLITYLVFPAMFLIGLVLIPIGWYRYSKREKKSIRELMSRQFTKEDLKTSQIGSRFFFILMIFTVINVLFISVVGFRTLRFMDSSRFCGTACHSVMNPEWVVYQKSPHARVPCVECHVGEGVEAFISTKLNGVRQMYLASLNLYNRPIPTPVHALRPARETCEKCHWPEKFYGRKLKIIPRFDRDEKNTVRYNTLSLKINTGKTSTTSGIHWHIAAKNEVSYTSVNDKREEIILVKVKQPDGTFKQYENKSLYFHTDKKSLHFRSMDCIDCHNRATHIYLSPDDALDGALSKKQIDPALPFIKREALHALTKNHASADAATKHIRIHLVNFYKERYPKVFSSKSKHLENAIQVLTEIYHTYNHHYMNLFWNEYPSFLTHKGCFRCHDNNLVDEQGKMISNDCTLCHSILSQEETAPFKYLEQLNPKDPQREKHKYLQKEFLETKF